MVKFKRKQKISVQMVKKIRNLYKEEAMFDFTIFVGSESLRCHKLMLATVSPWFEEWFRQDPTCSSLKVVNFTFEQLKAIVDFVYLGRFELKKKADLSKLFSKAKTIGIEMTGEILELGNEKQESVANASKGLSNKKDRENTVESPSRVNSPDLMPPPPVPSTSSVRTSRYEDVISDGDDDMDDYLPFSQVVPPTQQKKDANDDIEDEINNENDENSVDAFLPFSQVAPSPVKTSSPKQSKTPFKCDFAGCKHRFAKERELNNHKHHYHMKRNFVCPIRSCKRKFERGKMFADHMMQKHDDYVRERFERNRREKLRNGDGPLNSTASNDTVDDDTDVMEVLKVEFDDNSQNIFKC